MKRALIILSLVLLALAVWFVGPFIGVGEVWPLETIIVRAVLSLAFLLAALGLTVLAVIRWARRWRARSAARPKTASESFRSAWWTIGLLGAPIALLTGIAIWAIEEAYRNIDQINVEMRATLYELNKLDPAATFADLTQTNDVLTQVALLASREVGGVNLPMLDPGTDRAYLGDHYELMVSNHLRPHLMQRLEAQISSNLGNPNALYQALKVYLMLAQEGPMDVVYALGWIEEDLTQFLPGAYNQTLREELVRHTGVLLRSSRWNAYPVRADVVTQARQQLNTLSPDRLLYFRILSHPRVTAQPDWRPIEAGGPAISRVFVRASRKPLSAGIPGIYTYEGFHRVFLPLLGAAVKGQIEEEWILGQSGRGAITAQDAARIVDDVLNVYYAEFTRHWEEMLADLTLVSIESLSHFVEVSNVLSGPTSPIVNILRSASDETRLIDIPSDDPQVLGIVGGSLRSLLANDLLEAYADTPGSAELARRFAWLHALTDDNGAQLWQYRERLRSLYHRATQMMFSGTVPVETLQEVTQPLRASSAQISPIVENWTLQLLGGLDFSTGTNARAALNAQWQSQILPVCEAGISARYPFDRRAQVEVARADFVRLFGPGGLIDNFLNENMAGLVDRSARPWRWRTDAGLSSAALAQFETAAQIRDTFFGSGRDIQIAFSVMPEALDPKANEVTLDIGGQTLSFAHSDRPEPTPMVWPGPEIGARLTLQDNGGALHELRSYGAWDLFRLIDQFEVRWTNIADRSRLIANTNGLIAIFQLQSAQVLNPFANADLWSFECPRGF